MNYQDAFKIGSVCDGYIKCSYAALHSTDHGVLFALQRRDVDKHMNLDATANFAYDMPIVTAEFSDEYKGEKGWVPARLTQEAKDVIAKCFAAVKETKYTVWKVYDIVDPNNNPTNAKTGDRQKIEETYTNPATGNWKPTINDWKTLQAAMRNGQPAPKKFHHYEFTSEPVSARKYEDLLKIIEEDGIVYVRPVAIDWQPVDAENVTIIDPNGNEINLNVAIEAAQAKVDQAKKILLASGGTLIF